MDVSRFRKGPCKPNKTNLEHALEKEKNALIPSGQVSEAENGYLCACVYTHVYYFMCIDKKFS